MQRCRVVRNEEWFCNSILSFSAANLEPSSIYLLIHS
jgi:hypothetical protein